MLPEARSSLMPSRLIHGLFAEGRSIDESEEGRQRLAGYIAGSANQIVSRALNGNQFDGRGDQFHGSAHFVQRAKRIMRPMHEQNRYLQLWEMRSTHLLGAIRGT